MNLDGMIPDIPVGEWGESIVDWLTTHGGPVFDAFKSLITTVNDALLGVLLMPQAVVMAIIFALLGWLVRSPTFAVGTLLGFLLIIGMGLWLQAMQLLSLVILATVIAVVIAIPLGILAARNDTFSAILKPILDFMQTMPAFVYLIPAILFFSIGEAPGLVAMIIFSLPPGVRLTELGIRHVDGEKVEAGEAFGASSLQILRGIQLPLALPSIMAGINQVIMLGLSMAVIAGMVGADSLGKEVVAGVANVDIPRGVEGGIGVVIIAIFLDRLTGALGEPGQHPRSLLGWWRKRRGRPVTADSEANDSDELTEQLNRPTNAAAG